MQGVISQVYNRYEANQKWLFKEQLLYSTSDSFSLTFKSTSTGDFQDQEEKTVVVFCKATELSLKALYIYMCQVAFIPCNAISVCQKQNSCLMLLLSKCFNNAVAGCHVSFNRIFFSSLLKPQLMLATSFQSTRKSHSSNQGNTRDCFGGMFGFVLAGLILWVAEWLDEIA